MRPSLRWCLTSVFAAAVASGPASLFAQPLPDVVPMDTWGPAGTVSAVARQGDTLYVGGSFDYVGPGTGPFAAFAIDGLEPSAVATGFDGTIDHLVPLPTGGWVIAGQLREGPATTRQLARLDAHGRLDRGFYAEIAGGVYALATDGTRVFVGGALNAVNGIPRPGLAALDASTGALLPWHPALERTGSSPEVTALLIHNGTLFAAGRFDAVNGAPRDGFAAIDAVTGATTPLTQSVLDTVESMTAAGDTVYLVGRLPSFQTAGMAFSMSTGQVLPWSLPSSFTDVTRIVATPTRVYASSFTAVRALDPITGGTMGPVVIDNASIDAFDVDGDLLAVGLRRFSGGATAEVLTFDAGSGAARAWSLRLDTRVEEVAVSGGLVSMAGGFRSAGGVARGNLFALDIRTGRPTSFAPAVQGEVAALATVGNVVVAGGSFYRVDGVDRRGLAAMTDAGALLPWAPLEEGRVGALAVGGGSLFIGGDFKVVDGYSRPHLAGISLASGGVSAWLPVPDAEVLGLVATGDTLFAVGPFEAMATGPRGSGSAFSIRTGAPTDWDPRSDGAIWDVAVAGSTAGVVGSFTSLGQVSRQGVGFLDTRGAVLPVTLPYASIDARSIAGLGEHFFVGGSFQSGGATRHLVAVSMIRGIERWEPAFEDAFGTDVRMLARYTDLLVAGGTFTRVSGRRVLNLAVFRAGRADPPVGLRARVTGSVVTLSWAPPAGTGAASFIVEAGTAPGGIDIGRFTVGGLVVSGALAPGTYYVRVRAVVNGVDGQPSSEVILNVPAPPLPPQAPTALRAVVTGRTVSLQWTASAGNAETYVIDAGLSPGQTNLASFDTGVLDTTFAAPVAPGTYYVRVRARNGFGVSTPSNEVQVVVP